MKLRALKKSWKQSQVGLTGEPMTTQNIESKITAPIVKIIDEEQLCCPAKDSPTVL